MGQERFRDSDFSEEKTLRGGSTAHIVVQERLLVIAVLAFLSLALALALALALSFLAATLATFRLAALLDTS